MGWNKEGTRGLGTGSHRQKSANRAGKSDPAARGPRRGWVNVVVFCFGPGLLAPIASMDTAETLELEVPNGRVSTFQ